MLRRSLYALCAKDSTFTPQWREGALAEMRTVDDTWEKVRVVREAEDGTVFVQPLMRQGVIELQNAAGTGMLRRPQSFLAALSTVNPREALLQCLLSFYWIGLALFLPVLALYAVWFDTKLLEGERWGVARNADRAVKIDDYYPQEAEERARQRGQA